MGLFRRFIYDNFLRPSRLPYLDEVMRKLREAGYQGYTVAELNKQLQMGDSQQILLGGGKKCLVLRHDIDTDPRTAWLMAKIEHKYGFVGTYYFRLCTANDKYMKRIAELGHEVSYHYEEIGTYSKAHKLKTKEQALQCMQEVQELFADNISDFRKRHDVECKSIASHGEWINAKYLGLSNHALVADDVRKRCGIEVEAYDECFMRYFRKARIADLGQEKLWSPYPLEDAIGNSEPYLYILLHPRQWYTRWWCNIKSDTKRIFETFLYKL